SLISRVATQQWLQASTNWTQGVHNQNFTRLDYEYRVLCSAHYYGKDCDTLCRPRDDNFGHYTCGPSGEKVCLPGWEKDPTEPEWDYCTK
ncbi:Delta-like protein, partial [Caligus rogercresseyi]